MAGASVSTRGKRARPRGALSERTKPRSERRFKGVESGTRTSECAPGVVRIISRGAAKRREAKRRARTLARSFAS